MQPNGMGCFNLKLSHLHFGDVLKGEGLDAWSEWYRGCMMYEIL
jgi:hypothetical protein